MLMESFTALFKQTTFHSLKNTVLCISAYWGIIYKSYIIKVKNKTKHTKTKEKSPKEYGLTYVVVAHSKLNHLNSSIEA